MKKILFFLASGLFALTLQADDLTIKSGRVFKNFAIMGAAPNGILIFHENGKAVIPVKEFPDEYREKIAKYEKEIPAKRREAAKLKAIRDKKAKQEAAEKKKQEAARQARMKKYLAEEAARKQAEAEAAAQAQAEAEARAQAQAEEKRLRQQEVNAQTVYITRTGEKYHRNGCQYLRKSCIPISLSEAQSLGYEPCSRCW